MVYSLSPALVIALLASFSNVSYHQSSVPKPSAALLFLLLATLVLEVLELLLGQVLVAALRLETTSIMAIGGCIDIKVGVHLASALVLIVVMLRVHSGLLVATSVTIELCSGGVVSGIGVGQSSSSGGGSGSGGGFCLLLLPLGFARIIRVRVIVTMDGRVVASVLALRRGRNTRQARARRRSYGC